jgi:hypothetical protein
MAKHKRMGPMPKKLDIERVESVAAMGGTNEQIAAALGIAKGTLFNIRKRDKAVDEAIQRGKDKVDIQVVAALYKKALAGDTTAMIFWLKNRRPNEWRDRHELDHSGEVKATVKFIYGNGNGERKE